MSVRERIPWQVRLLAKLALSRLPVSYRTWERIGLFKHGCMETSEYAIDVFRAHFSNGYLPPKFVALEIGPGDSLSTAVVAKAFGAERSYLIDVGPFARTDLELYRELAVVLQSIGRHMGNLSRCTTIAQLMHACNAFYLTEGISSFGKIADASVDFIFSQAALEHIRRHDFDNLVREMHRVLKPKGFASHNVDLKDHLGGRLNNLRFSERVWESEWMAGSGFYTNRIRFGEMLDRFRLNGFEVEVKRVERFRAIPTARSVMAPQFRTLSESDLSVTGFDVVLRRQSG